MNKLLLASLCLPVAGWAEVCTIQVNNYCWVSENGESLSLAGCADKGCPATVGGSNELRYPLVPCAKGSTDWCHQTGTDYLVIEGATVRRPTAKPTKGN